MIRLLAIVPMTLGSSELVTVERLRLIGTAIASVASCVAAVLAYLNGREARAAKREARQARRIAASRRHVVRDPEHEQAIVIDHPAERAEDRP